MAVLVGGAPDPKKKSEEQFKEMQWVEIEDFKVYTSSMGGFKIRSKSGAKRVMEQRWYVLSQWSEPVREMVAAGDWAALSKVPFVKNGNTGLYLDIHRAADDSVFSVQVVEPRPWEGGRYALMTPAVVLTDDDARAVAAMFR